jgi:hypothetical protein
MDNIKTIKNKISEEKQYEVIDKIINEEFNNQKLTDALTIKFKEKGFPVRLITLLFAGEQTWEDVPELAKVAFVDATKEVLSDMEILDIDKWFDDQTLATYESKVNELKSVDSIFIQNATKVDDFNYSGYISYETIYNAFNNSLLVYNKETQRESTYKKLGTTGRTLREITLNEKAVEEIKEAMINGTYEQDMVIYNVLMTKPDITLQINETQKLENIYDLEIVPNYDRKSKHYTIVNIVDGYHRTMACVRAYSECLKKGRKLEGGLFVKITIRDIQGAKNIINQTFKRSDAGRQWLSQMASTDYNEFIELLVKTSNVLSKGKVSRTFEEYEATRSLTYSYILSQSIEKYSNLKIENKIQRKVMADKFASIVDGLFDCFMIKYNDLDTIKKETYLMDANIFVGYMAIATELRLVEDYEGVLIKISEKITNISDEHISMLKLKGKETSIKRIYDYFQKIAKEVIENA